MSDTVPELFVPLITRNNVTYRNLSRICLNPEEKKFLGSEAAGITSLLTWPEEKFAVLSRIAKRYTLPVSTLRAWMNKVEMSLPLTNRPGRPSAMDDEAAKHFQSILESRRAEKNAVPLAEAILLIGAGTTETKIRLGKRSNCVHSSFQPCFEMRKKPSWSSRH